eukprot:3030611-Prorocentrum_lima.AAC.1
MRISKLALVYANQRRRRTLADVNTSRREMEMSNRINEQKPMRKRNIPGMASPMTRMCQADGLAYVSISVTV